MQNITAVIVCSNTQSLVKECLNAFRKCHPEMMMIIIDGSDADDECRRYVETLSSPYTTLMLYPYNIGHGRGMDAGIGLVNTKYAVIFDSDTEMNGSPLERMMGLMEDDTFGVGHIGYVNQNGQDIPGGIKYLHPFFQLINVENYHKFHPYIHHGAPCVKTMIEINRQGLSDKILKSFPVFEYVLHKHSGTVNARLAKGLTPIEWDK